MTDDEKRPRGEAEQAEPSLSGESPSPGLLGWVISAVIIVILIGAGATVSVYWMGNKPKASRRKPKPTATLVEVAPVERGDHRLSVSAMGTVRVASRVGLAPRVGGEVKSVSPRLVPGGFLREGELVAVIDDEDYRIATREREAELSRRLAEKQQIEQQLRQRKADLVRAESEVALEKARITVARQEAELFSENLSDEDRRFVLREPQLASVMAARDAASASVEAVKASLTATDASIEATRIAIERARLHEKRTRVVAPFDAVVIEKSVDPGAQVNSGSPVAVLAATDVFWIEVAIPISHLRWIHIPRAEGDTASTATISHDMAWGGGNTRQGRVIRLLPEVETQGRLARVLVAVTDPLCRLAENRDDPQVLIGSYVSVSIEGSTLSDVAIVDRNYIHDGEHVWVMDGEDQLDIRKVEIVWSDNDIACVRSGLASGDRLVTSDLGSPVQGMALRTGKKDKDGKRGKDGDARENGGGR